MNDGSENIESARDAEFEAALDRQLSRVLSGAASIDECCAADPVHAEDLKQLLRLALSGQAVLQAEVAEAALPGDATDGWSAREKLLAQADSFFSEHAPASRRMRLRPLALASGLFLLIFAGTALATGSASPDSMLYPLKQRMESLRTTLAIQELDQARAEAGHADRRLDELEKMIGEGKSEYAGDLLASYEKHINDASEHAAAAAAEGEDTAEVDTVIASVRERHVALMVSLGLEKNKDESGRNPSDGQEENGGSGSGEPDSPGAPGEAGGHESGGETGGTESGTDMPDSYEQPGNDGHDGDSGDAGQAPSDESGHDQSSGEDSHDYEAPKQDERHSESSDHDGMVPARS